MRDGVFLSLHLCVCVWEKDILCKPMTVSSVLALAYNNRLTVPAVNKSLEEIFRSIMINCEIITPFQSYFSKVSCQIRSTFL